AVLREPEEDGGGAGDDREHEHAAERGDLEHRAVEGGRAVLRGPAQHGLVEPAGGAGHDDVADEQEEHDGRDADEEREEYREHDGGVEAADVLLDEAQHAGEGVARGASGRGREGAAADREEQLHERSRRVAGCMPRGKNVIEFREVSKRFGAPARPGRAVVEALAGITLEIPAGGVWEGVGPCGRGKSTLFALLLGFIHATTGSVRVRGLEPRRYARRHGAAYLPERFRLPGEWRVRTALRALARLEGIARGAA